MQLYYQTINFNCVYFSFITILIFTIVLTINKLHYLIIFNYYYSLIVIIDSK